MQSRPLSLLLDTNVLSAYLMPGHEMRPIYGPFLTGKDLSISPVAVGEILIAINRLDEPVQHDIRQSLAAIPRLAFREDIAIFWFLLRPLTPRRIGQNDLWMAAFALSYDLILVTDDRPLAERLRGTTIQGRTLRIVSRHLGNVIQDAAIWKIDRALDCPYHRAAFRALGFSPIFLVHSGR